METAKAAASLISNSRNYYLILLEQLRFPNFAEGGIMFIQKFKACLRFVGILLLRTLLGIVAGYLWLFAVVYLFHIIMDVRMPRDPFDHFYDSGPPMEGRYGGRAGEFYGDALQIGLIGFRVWFAVGILWGFLQGRLDLRKLLKIKRRHA